MNKENLIGHIPDNIYQQVLGVVEIDGPRRMSNFLGQCAHECANFTVFVENLNYSGDALWTLFHTHFIDRNEADLYAKHPEKIANRIYANRMGNGDEASGDGWKYRGRGSLQTTSKANYKSLGDHLGIDLVKFPELVATDYAIASAAFFFTKNNLWSICDKGVDMATITILTRKINGGNNGLQDRINKTQAFYNLLTKVNEAV